MHLAKLLKRGSNLLLLDEPTNDLDVDTLRALEEALLNFAGCAVVISHDRWFLDRIATHMLAFEGDSQVVWFEGNYQDYEADRHAPPRRGGRPAAPHQVPEAHEDSITQLLNYPEYSITRFRIPQPPCRSFDCGGLCRRRRGGGGRRCDCWRR